MIMNVEQNSFSGVVLNVRRMVGIKEIIGSKVQWRRQLWGTCPLDFQI